ncbi:hypothetical protein OKA04_19620 [Luteolibacter flavescens]|uniref:Uncharacterized protein n=1 Tax=Luteolibacter flavescens TaxID=1859460 RepID=A0ABT3FTS1_9BACT|nr:hypothetical protein [Luteolibacter flavescens]MCW1886958.1 hypothetical protein [Luteolibacter flavescens]
MKLDRAVILSGVLAGLIPLALAQDLLPGPEDLPPPLEDEQILLPESGEDGVIDRVRPGSGAKPLHSAKGSGPSQVIGEGGGTRLLHYRTANPASTKPSFFHRLVAATADGRQFLVYHDESRSPEPLARVNARGDVATVSRWSCIRAHFAPDYKPVNIRKLRGDRFLKTAPGFERFTIRDIAWGESVLICSGHLTISGGDYPFLSRLLFTDKGEVSDHQILWTTWKSGVATRLQRNSAADSIPRSLHQQDQLVLWKNAGPRSSKDLPAGFEKSAWQCTDLTTGTTRLLAETDPVDRTRLEQIEQAIGAR